MTTDPVPNPEVLKEVSEAFGKYFNKGDGKRRHWPKALRQLAARAVAEGHGAQVVAKAANVCRGSVINWCNHERNPPAEPPMELKVVKSREHNPVEDSKAELKTAVARIFFRSGVILECPVSAVSSEILSALNEVVR